jgi:hypothetical protein
MANGCGVPPPFFPGPTALDAKWLVAETREYAGQNSAVALAGSARFSRTFSP